MSPSSLRGSRLDALTEEQRRNLLPGTRAEETFGVYVADFWIGSDGRWYTRRNGMPTRTPWPALARLTEEVYSKGPPAAPDRPTPTPDVPRCSPERREALERIASGTAGASPSEVATARKALGL